METPVTTRQRSRLRPVTKTPDSDLSQETPLNISSYVKAIEQNIPFKKCDDQDEESDAFSLTQVFGGVPDTQPPKGEVFWNYNASPNSNRDDLRKKILQGDSPGSSEQNKSKSPPKALTPTIRFRTRPQTESSPAPDDDDQLNELMQISKQFATRNPDTDSRETINCNVDSNQNTKTSKPVVDTFGDDDDDFDALLSQIEMPTDISDNKQTSDKTILSKKNLHQSGPPNSTLNMSTKVPLPPVPSGKTSFKRFNSADSIKPYQPNPVRNRNNSGTVMKTWQRSNSSPVGAKKCSKEEIERKKQAAIRRRMEKSSQR